MLNVQADVDYGTGEINVTLPKALYSKASNAALKGDLQWDLLDLIDSEVQAQVRRGIERHMVEEAREFAIATGIKPSEIRLSDGYTWKGEEHKPVAYARGWIGQVSFSERLMQYPKEYRDAVYIHEISHMTGWGDLRENQAAQAGKLPSTKGATACRFGTCCSTFVPDYHAIHDTYVYNEYSTKIHGNKKPKGAAKTRWSTLEATGHAVRQGGKNDYVGTNEAMEQVGLGAVHSALAVLIFKLVNQHLRVIFA